VKPSDKKDENDRLREGTLPLSPFSDAVPLTIPPGLNGQASLDFADSANACASQWASPLPIDSRPVPEFPVDALPEPDFPTSEVGASS
jgi:hypothetical protein